MKSALTVSQPNAAIIISNGRNTPPKPKTERNDAHKREKIQEIFDGAAKAEEKRINAAATADYIRLRFAAEQIPKTTYGTKLKQKLHIGPKKETRTSLLDKAQQKYIEGPLARDADLKAEKREWRKAACVEFAHNGVGRVMSLTAGVAGHAVHASSSAVAMPHSVGYVAQAPITSLGRIASEMLQIRINKAGKPKLPHDVQNPPSLKEVRAGFKDTTRTLRQENKRLLAAIEKASQSLSARNDVRALDELIGELSQEGDALADSQKKYTYRWAAFKRQYMGRRWGGAVSTVASAVAAPLNAVAPLAGSAAQAGTIPLQFMAGYFDYMADKNYTLRAATKKLDLASLLKPESRNKSLEEIVPEDIDTANAARFYEEHPQAILSVTQEIYCYQLAELMYTERKLVQEIESKKLTFRFVPDALLPQRIFRGDLKETLLQEKIKEYDAVRDDIANLKKQIGHFERGETDELDLGSTIGKALTKPFYFFWEGTKARYNNKIGEFWAQTFQRVGNNFHMLSSVGEAGIVDDILNDYYGRDFVEHGLAALHREATENAMPNGAASGLVATELFSGPVVGVTVIPARDHKDTVDRTKLAVPSCLNKGPQAGTPKEELSDAVKCRLIAKDRKGKFAKAYGLDEDLFPAKSSGKSKTGEALADPFEGKIHHLKQTKEELEKALSTKDLPKETRKDLQDSHAETQKSLKQQLKAQKIRNEWTDLKVRMNEIDRSWIVGDVGNDKRGKPIVIDLRDSAACYRENVPLQKRLWHVLKAIPPGMFSAPILAVDAWKTKRARQDARQAVVERQHLIRRGQQVVARQTPPKVSLELDQTLAVLSGKDDDFTASRYLDVFAEYKSERSDTEYLLQDMLNQPVWHGSQSPFVLKQETADAAAQLRSLHLTELAQLNSDQQLRSLQNLKRLYLCATSLRADTKLKLCACEVNPRASMNDESDLRDAEETLRGIAKALEEIICTLDAQFAPVVEANQNQSVESTGQSIPSKEEPAENPIDPQWYGRLG